MFFTTESRIFEPLDTHQASTGQKYFYIIVQPKHTLSTKAWVIVCSCWSLSTEHDYEEVRAQDCLILKVKLMSFLLLSMVESYKNCKAEAISQNPTNIFIVYRTAVFSLQKSFHLSSEDTWSSNRYYQRIRISVTKLISYKNVHASIKIIDLNKHILISYKGQNYIS